ncbi:MAG TPA: hypothetical protein VIP70_08565 [Nitrososphaeraceae archaeon]
MTFKDLQKLVGSQAGPEQTQILQRLGDKEFWYWDQTQRERYPYKRRLLLQAHSRITKKRRNRKAIV